MICTPQSIFSWTFRISGASTGPAELQFDFFTEQGKLTFDDVDYRIHKHGVFSGLWTLEHEGTIFAEARKANPLIRSFEVSSEDLPFTLRAQSPLTRCYNFLRDGGILGTIRTAHPFTRRASIECDAIVPERDQLFSFWLAVLTWRRAANNSNSST